MNVRKCMAVALVLALAAGWLVSPVLAAPAVQDVQVSFFDTALAWIGQVLGFESLASSAQGKARSGPPANPGADSNPSPDADTQTLTDDDSPPANTEGGVLGEPNG